MEHAPDCELDDGYSVWPQWQLERHLLELLKDSLAETDAAKRHEMHCEMQKLVSTQSGIIIPYHTNILDANNPKIKGFSNVPLGQFGGNGWAEHIWKEA
ncbi:MAG TPA: hypothetical protein EYN87_08400 [Gammaproteobacteria bacterium]|nr:hypothetical protein [Gammaproteobacteria bacterium]